VSFCEHYEETYAVVVDDVRDDSDLSGEGARFEEDDCSTESVMFLKNLFPQRRTSPNLDEALEVLFLRQKQHQPNVLLTTF
jgi:hypothetical protein